MKKSIILILIVVAIIFLVFLVFFNSSVKIPETKLSDVQENFLNDFRPELTQSEDDAFAFLTKNLISGGPPKDGIPAIDNPKFTNVKEADEWLLPNDVVFGIVYNGEIKAYPQRILVWHEIVNDIAGNEPITISYCPLTGSAIGFKDGIAKEIPSTFGVSGKLLNSNLVMYDRATDSYWPQILSQAITNPAKGIQLNEFPVVWTTWEKWKNKYPQTKVLSSETGFFRNYSENGDPYGSYLSEDKGYYSSDNLVFEPLNIDERLPKKEVVIGLRNSNHEAVAILKSALKDKGTMEVSLGQKNIILTYDYDLDFYQAIDKESEEVVNSFDVMWFAWAAFYPDTKLVQ